MTNPELILEWVEADRIKQYSIQAEESELKRVRIGRDPARCELVLVDPTVSGLHIEIFFDPQQQVFCLRNLREQNPPRLNGHFLIQDEMVIKQGDRLYLGDLCLQIRQVTGTASSSSPYTLLLSPESELAHLQAPSTQPEITGANHPTYGLVCPNCGQPSSYQHLDLGCPWCGTSLASAQSILLG